MNRNKTIIGLSDSMVIVEDGITGGSMEAWPNALTGRKPPYVPVYADYPESALGNKLLLDKGARSIGRSRQNRRANVMPLL